MFFSPKITFKEWGRITKPNNVSPLLISVLGFEIVHGLSGTLESCCVCRHVVGFSKFHPDPVLGSYVNIV